MFDNLRQLNEAKAAKLENQQERAEKELSELQTQEVFVKSIKALAEFMEGNTSKTVVLNQLRDYATSQDIDSLSQSIDSLHGTLKTHENTDISPVVDVLNKAVDNLEKIPKDHPEKLTIPTPKDYSKQFDTLVAVMESVKDEIEAQETVVEAPVVNVEAPNVQVDAPDLKPLAKELDKALSKSFNTSVSKIKIPKPADIKPIVAEQKKTTKAIDRLYKLMEEMPMGGGGGGGAPQPVNYALKIATSGSDTFVAEALPGTTSSAAKWRIQKVDTNGNVTWKDGNDAFDNTATDITTGDFS